MASKQPAKRNPRSRGHSHQTIDAALRATAECYGNYKDAAAMLEAKGKYVTPATIKKWVEGDYYFRFLDMRDELTPKVEAKLARDMLDIAGRAVHTGNLAVERSFERLQAGEEDDPSRAAVNLTRVAQMSTDKMLTLTGRPATITENHDVEGLLRSLVSMGILRAPDEPVAIEATAEEDVA